MIKIDKVTKSYEGKKVVDNLSLEIKDGTIFGFLGPNGAGKTTTIKMLVGLCKPDSGQIEIDKKALNRQIIGYMPEDPYFYEQLTALEFLRFMRNLFVHRGLNIEKTLKLVGLEKAAKQKIREFSKGMKQRLGLAQAIINDPKYLFLDEPLDGLDPIGRLEIKKILLQLKKEGKTIFFNSHILSDVEEICDEIGIINSGKLIYSGSVKKFTGKETLENKFVNEILQVNKLEG